MVLQQEVTEVYLQLGALTQDVPSRGMQLLAAPAPQSVPCSHWGAGMDDPGDTQLKQPVSSSQQEHIPQISHWLIHTPSKDAIRLRLPYAIQSLCAKHRIDKMDGGD